MIPGISAAGATPRDRQFTALADAEFLYNGVTHTPPLYPLPPLQAGVSPTLIARAIVEHLAMPICLLDAGLPRSPTVPHHSLGGQIAACVSTGQAMTPECVRHLFLEGVYWGQQLGQQLKKSGYLVIGECVVAGTTTAQALLTGLGIDATNRVNSSHPTCNHQQKQQIVQQGLARSQLPLPPPAKLPDILELVAAIGDPMQPVVAGMLLTASRDCGVLLAGGTQMLAVYALAQALATAPPAIPWQPEQVVIGTTRWVVEDPTGDTIALAQAIGPVPLLATQLTFRHARFAPLRAYEQGFVKEGIGAGGLAISASLSAGWTQTDLLSAIEDLCERAQTIQPNCSNPP